MHIPTYVVIKRKKYVRVAIIVKSSSDDFSEKRRKFVRIEIRFVLATNIFFIIHLRSLFFLNNIIFKIFTIKIVITLPRGFYLQRFYFIKCKLKFIQRNDRVI